MDNVAQLVESFRQFRIRFQQNSDALETELAGRPALPEFASRHNGSLLAHHAQTSPSGPQQDIDHGPGRKRRRIDQHPEQSTMTRPSTHDSEDDEAELEAESSRQSMQGVAAGSLPQAAFDFTPHRQPDTVSRKSLKTYSKKSQGPNRRAESPLKSNLSFEHYTLAPHRQTQPRLNSMPQSGSAQESTEQRRAGSLPQPLSNATWPRPPTTKANPPQPKRGPSGAFREAHLSENVLTQHHRQSRSDDGIADHSQGPQSNQPRLPGRPRVSAREFIHHEANSNSTEEDFISSQSSRPSPGGQSKEGDPSTQQSDYDDEHNSNVADAIDLSSILRGLTVNEVGSSILLPSSRVPSEVIEGVQKLLLEMEEAGYVWQQIEDPTICLRQDFRNQPDTIRSALEGSDVACRTCTNSSSPCLKVTTDMNDTPLLILLPLYEEERVKHKPSTWQYWLLPERKRAPVKVFKTV